MIDHATSGLALKALRDPSVAGELKVILSEPDQTTADILIVALETGVGSRMLATGASVDVAEGTARQVAERVKREWQSRHGDR